MVQSNADLDLDLDLDLKKNLLNEQIGPFKQTLKGSKFRFSEAVWGCLIKETSTSKTRAIFNKICEQYWVCFVFAREQINFKVRAARSKITPALG